MEDEKYEKRVQFHRSLDEKIVTRERQSSLVEAALNDNGVFNTSTFATTPRIPRAVNYMNPQERARVVDCVAPNSSIQTPNYEGVLAFFFCLSLQAFIHSLILHIDFL